MDDATRTLLMSAALEQVSDRLTVYRRQVGTRIRAKCCSRNSANAVGPRQLEQAAAAVEEEALRQKLAGFFADSGGVADALTASA